MMLSILQDQSHAKILLATISSVVLTTGCNSGITVNNNEASNCNTFFVNNRMHENDDIRFFLQLFRLCQLL